MLEWSQSLGSLIVRASIVDWTIFVGGVVGLVYWLGTWTHDHFRRRGIPFVRPVPFLGSMGPLVSGRVSRNDFALGLYNEHKNRRAVGFFQFWRPILFLRDPELIKMVAVKKFDHFVDHQAVTSEKIDPVFGRNLFSLTGQAWRDMRATLSPTFTSSKLRHIFKLIDRCGEQMVDYLQHTVKNTPGVFSVNIKDLFTRFANDVIATSAFGIECDSLRFPENEFYRKGHELTTFKGLRILISLGYMLSPKLMELLRVRVNNPKLEGFFHDIVHNTINERKRRGIYRPDMLQLLMQAREGDLRAEAEDEKETLKGATTKKLSDNDMTAQAVIFFFAGFDTVSNALSYCAHALASHPEVRQRLQNEVDAAFEKNGGKLTYEAVQEFKYFDMFINEVLRLYAAVPTLDRKCTEDLVIPAQGDEPAYALRKGDIVWIPVLPLHRDPRFWERADEFDPERFSEENKHKIKPFTFHPFGVGPRNCIGSRLALAELKIALSHILRHFDVVATEKTPKVVEYDPKFRGALKGGFWVGIRTRSQ